MQRTSNHFILNVQYCKSCDTHNWCTHHDEQKYLNTYQKLKHHLQKLFGKDIYVQGNVIPSQLVPIKPAQNKYFNSKTNKYVTFPAIGAFQISFGNQIIFSKKKTNNWPNFTEVADKVYFKLNGKQRSPQQKQNSIANAQERIHSADVDVKTEKDNLSMKNQSFLDHNDKRSTFYKSKPNQQKNFTLTDHFRNYHNADYKNPIDVKSNSDDFFTTNPTDNQNQLSEASSFRNNNSSERDFLEFKRNFESGLSEHGVKLSELIKKKGYMKEDLGKKQMIIRLDSIQEESLLVDENASFNYGQNVNLTNTHSTFKSKSKDSHQKLMKRFNDDFQQLQAKFKKFEQKVQTIRQENKKFDHHNKDFQMGKINEKLMKEINDYKKKQKKLRNSQMNQLDLEDLQGEQGMMDNPIVFARRKLKNIEDYINGTEQEKNQKLKKIYGEWKLLKKPYKGKSYVSPYKIEVKKRNTEDKIQPQFKNSNELNDYTSSSSSQESQQIHSKNTDLHSSNQKLPQMQNMKMKSPQNKQVLTQQKFYSTARDKFNEIGNRKLKKDKKLIPHSHSATLNQFHRASDGVKLNTFDHYQQAAQKSDQFLSVNSNEIQPRTFYSNEKSYNKGRKLKSIPKNCQKQNFLTNQTSSRGRQLSRSSSNINEERMINQVINSKKAKLNSQIGSGHSNASASKSKNFRSKKKQNISKSKSKDNSPFKQKIINLMEDQQCDINGSSSVQSNEENLVQDSQEHSQSLNNNFLEKDAKSKFSNLKPSQARKLKNYEKGIGENKQWKEKDQEYVKVNKVRKNLKKEQTNGNQQTEQRSSRYLTSQKKFSQEQRGSQGQIVTSYHKLEKKSKNQVLKQLQKQKKFKKDKLNTEDHQVQEKYKKRSKEQKIMKIQNNSQDEDQIQQYPQGQSLKIQKETKASKNRKQTKDKLIKGKQRVKEKNKQTSEEQGSDQSENQVAEFSENQAEPQGKNIGERQLKIKQQNTKKISKTTKKETQHSKKIENQQQSESEENENEEILEKNNNRVKAGKSKQKENLVKKKSKNEKSQNQDDSIKNQTSQSDEQESVSYGKSNNATEKDTLPSRNKELSNKKQDSNQNELKKKKISPKIKQEELDQAKEEEQSRQCEQQQERIEPVKTDKKKSKAKKTERQTDKNLNKNLKYKSSNKTKIQQSKKIKNTDQSCDDEQNSQLQGQREKQSEKNQQNGQFMEEQELLNTKQIKETSKTSNKGVKTTNKKSKQTKQNKSKGKEIEKVKSKQKTLKNNPNTKNLSQDEQDHEEDQLDDSSNSVQSKNSQTSDNEDSQFQKTDQIIDNSNYSHNKISKNPDQIAKNKKQNSKKQKKETKLNRSQGKNGTDDQVSEQEQPKQLLQEHSEQDKIQQSDECIEVNHQGSETQQLLKSSKSKQSKSKIKSIKESSLKSKKLTEIKKKDIRQKPELNEASNSQSHSEQQEQPSTILKKQSQQNSTKNNKKNPKQKSKRQNSEILSEQDGQEDPEQSDENKSQSQQQQNQKTKDKAHSKGLKATKISEKSQQQKKSPQIENENFKTSKTNVNKKNKEKTNNQSISPEEQQISSGFQSKSNKNNNKSKGKSLLKRQQQQHSQTEQQQDQNSEQQRQASESVLQPQNEMVQNSSQKPNKSKSSPSKSKKHNKQAKQIQQDSSTFNQTNKTKLKEEQSKQKGQCQNKQKKNPKVQCTNQNDQGQNLNGETQNLSQDQYTSQLNEQPGDNLSDQLQKESKGQNESASVTNQKQKPKLTKKNSIGQKNSKKSSKQNSKVQKSQKSHQSSQNQEVKGENEQQSETVKQSQAENQTQETPQNGNINILRKKKSANKSKKDNKAKNSLQKSKNSSNRSSQEKKQQMEQEESPESLQQLSQGQQTQNRKKLKKTKQQAKVNKKNKANSAITPQQQQSHPIQSSQIQQNNLQQHQNKQVVENNVSLQKSQEKLSQNLQESKDADPQKSQQKKQLQIRLNTARTNKTSRKNKILNVYHTSRDPHCQDEQKQEQENQKVAQVQDQKANSDHQDKVGTQCDPLSNNKERSRIKKHSIDAGTQVNTSHIIQHNKNSDEINQNSSLSKQTQNIQPKQKVQATQQQNMSQLALQTRQLQPQLDLSLEDRQDQILPIESSMNGNQDDIRQEKCSSQFSNVNNNADFNSSAIRSSQKQEESIYPEQSINSSPKYNNSGKATRAPITKQFMGQGLNLELQKYPLLLKNPHLHHKHMLSDLSADNPQSSIIGRLPQSIISQSPILFTPKSLQLQKLHSNHPLPNLMKCLKILCDINEFLIIRLFQNPSMKIDPDNVFNKIFGVWLCVNYEWKCITVDLNQILLSNPNLPYYLNHQKNQLWPYILQLALVKALNGYKTLLSTPCHKLFTLMTGSNSLFFNIKEDPTKNSRILRYISDCQNKNFVLHAQKVEKTLEELQKKDKQSRIYYVLSQKIVNDGQVLLQIKESTSQQSRWIRLNKFVQQFKSIEILQLRLNHNFTSLPIPRPSNTSNLTILELQFLQQSFGSITLSTQSGSSTSIMKTLLYREQKSNMLKLVGQAKEKNKSILFFDCYFGQNTKYYLFVQTKQDTRVTYLGQNQPLIRIVEEINSQGLKNDYTQYLPVKNIHSSNTNTVRFQKQNATFFKQKAPQKLTKSKFGQTGMSFKSQQDKISRLRQNFVQYLLKGKD